jgi:hypothetical protein
MTYITAHLAVNLTTARETSHPDTSSLSSKNEFS